MEPQSGTRKHVLIVDDEPAVALMFEQLMASEGHEVTRAKDGREALAAIAARPPDLILLDLDMPHVGGYEVCRQIKLDPATRLTPVVIITGQAEQAAKLRAWDLGADDFLTKPCQTVEVLARCRSLLRVKSLVDELDSAQSVIFALARTLEAKNCYTHGHSERVTGYALVLAGRLGLTPKDQEVLRRGSLLHDIGKISTPDAILDKPGRLTAEEYEEVKRHPLEGARILDPLRSLRDTVPLVRWHHERLDGKGYPDGLSGGSIPLLVRVLTVADIYDAVASERPYRPALPMPQCLALLRSLADDGGLDPELVQCFCQVPAVPCTVPGLVSL